MGNELDAPAGGRTVDSAGGSAGETRAQAAAVDRRERVFTALIELACKNLPLPPCVEFGKLVTMRATAAYAALRDLETAGRVSLISKPKTRRVVVIREGEHAGKRTATVKEARRWVAKPPKMKPPPKRSNNAGRPCLWCENPLSETASDHASYCCNGCAKEHGRHGFGPNRRQVVERIEHIKRQPKGCATVEQFIANGGVVYTEPLVRPA